MTNSLFNSDELEAQRRLAEPEDAPVPEERFDALIVAV